MAVYRIYNSSNMASNITRFSLCDIDLNVEFTPLPDLNFNAEEIFFHEEAKEFNNDIGIVFVNLYAFSFVTFVCTKKKKALSPLLHY